MLRDSGEGRKVRSVPDSVRWRAGGGIKAEREDPEWVYGKGVGEKVGRKGGGGGEKVGRKGGGVVGGRRVSR